MIEGQDNSFMTKTALKCLIRSAVEPLLDNPESGVVFYRIEDFSGVSGLFKRLEFSEVESVDYSDKAGNLVEKVWANTEFLCVLTHRFVSIIIWDNNTGDKDLVRYYSLYNSKLQYEPLDIIKRNSKVDIAPYQEKYNPDRRDNNLLNLSIRRLISNIDEAVGDAVLGYAEKTAETLSEGDYVQNKSRMIAHEIKNQLSICDLYTEIIRKKLSDENLDKDSIKKSIESIDKAIKMANNSLISLRTTENSKIENISVREIIEGSIELAKVYAEGKNIELKVESDEDYNIVADKEKTISILINLIKNASEAFVADEINNSVLQNDKYIQIKVEKEEGFVNILISNNAKGIAEPEKIFESGFSTKTNGNGLGLWICKKYAEEQGANLVLTRSSEDFTEFTLSFSEIK